MPNKIEVVNNAIDFFTRVNIKIVLVDNKTLAQLIIDQNVGFVNIST